MSRHVVERGARVTPHVGQRGAVELWVSRAARPARRGTALSARRARRAGAIAGARVGHAPPSATALSGRRRLSASCGCGLMPATALGATPLRARVARRAGGGAGEASGAHGDLLITWVAQPCLLASRAARRTETLRLKSLTTATHAEAAPPPRRLGGWARDRSESRLASVGAAAGGSEGRLLPSGATAGQTSEPIAR